MCDPAITKNDGAELAPGVLNCSITAVVRPSNTVYPGSQCPGCGTPIKPWQNIPVISWLMLRGQCAQCGMRISARYPVVELLTGLISGFAACQYGFGPEAISALVLIWVLIALTGIDMDTKLLPDNITLPLLWLGLGVNLFNVWTPLSSAVMGAMLGYSSLWSVSGYSNW